MGWRRLVALGATAFALVVVGVVNGVVVDAGAQEAVAKRAVAPPRPVRRSLAPPRQHAAWSPLLHPGFDVFLATGAVFHDRLLFAIPGNGQTWDLLLTFRSDLDYAGPWGEGWWSSLSGHLVVDPSGDVVVTDEHALEHRFTPNGDGTFRSPAGTWAVLEAIRKGRSTRTIGHRLTDADGWTRRYDARGRWVGLARPDGREIKLGRGPGERLTKVTTPEKRKIKLRYDRGGRVSTLKDWARRTFRFVHDAEGRLVSIERPLRPGDATPPAWRYVYDAAGRLVSATNSAGQVLGTAEYDAQDRVVAIRSFDGDALFTHGDGVVNATSRAGVRTDFAYDIAGRLTREDFRVVGGGSESEFFEYDSSGRLVRQTLPGRDERRWTFAAAGDPRDLCRPLTFAHRPADFPTSPDLVTTYETLAGTGLLASETRPDGARWDYEYDARGNVVRMTMPATTTEAGPRRPVWQYEYDSLSREVSRTGPDGTVDRSTYARAPSDLVVREIRDVGTGADPDTGAPFVNERFDSTYDSAGRLVRTTYSDGSSEQWTYDPWDRVTAHVDGNGVETTFEYDAVGNRTAIERPFLGEDGAPVGGGVRRSTAAYDAHGRVVRTQRLAADGTTVVSADTYAYSGLVHPSRVVDPLGSVTTLTYDHRGRRVTETREGVAEEPDAVTTFEYDAAGNLVRRTNPVGEEVQYVYDGYQRQVEQVDGAMVRTIHTYDAAGRFATRTVRDADGDDLSRERYTYDGLGNLVRSEADRFVDPAVTQNVDVDEYFYDGAGRRAVHVGPRGARTLFAYDGLGRLVRRDDEGLAQATEYEFDARGRPVTHREIRGTGSATPIVRTQTLGYDGIGNVLRQADVTGAETTYAYDSLGNVVRSVAPDGTELRSVYDAQSRIVRDSRPGTGVTDEQYAYDAAGNLVSFTGSDGRTATHVYDVHGRRTSSAVNGTTTATYTYDAADRLISGADPVATIDYEYDSRGMVSVVAASTGEMQTFAYDGLQRLVGGDDTRATQTMTLVRGYDSEGGLVLDQQNGVASRQSFGQGGVIFNLVTPNGMSYDYDCDSCGRITAMRRDGAAYVAVEYVAGTRVPSRVVHPDMTSAYEYDGFDRRVRADHDAEDVDSRWDAVRTRAGFITSQAREDGTGDTYQYDSLDRLVRHENTGPGGASELTTELTYDAVLDRPASIRSSLDDVVAKSPGPGKHVAPVAYDALGRMSSVGLLPLTYDAGLRATNMYETRPAHTAGERLVTLDAFGRVVRVTLPDGSPIATYAYDVLGRPVLAQELEFTGAIVLERQRAFVGCRLVSELSPAGKPGFDLFYVMHPATSGHYASGFDDSFFEEHLWQDDCHAIPRQTVYRGATAMAVQERYDRFDTWGAAHFEGPPANPQPFRGAPSLQSLVNPQAEASSYASGLVFGWSVGGPDPFPRRPQDPFLPRPLDPNQPGGVPPFPPGPPLRGDPVVVPPVVNPVPPAEHSRRVCDEGLARVCRAITALGAQADAAAKCRDQQASALNEIARQALNVERGQAKAQAALDQLASQAEYLEQLKVLDTSLGIAAIGSALRSVASKLGAARAAITSIADGIKKGASRVTRGIAGSRIAAEEFKVASEAVRKLAEEGASELGGQISGDVAGKQGVQGLGLSLFGELGLSIGQLLAGATFEGVAAELRADIYEAEAAQRISRSKIREQQEILDLLARNKETIRANAAAACANLESGLAYAEAWPSPELEAKKRDAALLKDLLSAEGVR